MEHIFQAVLLLFCLLPMPYSGVGQADTLIGLPSVEVRAERILPTVTSLNSIDLDSSSNRPNRYFSVASMLEGQSHCHIRSYGIGGLASASVRGGSASQTAVYWEGMPIESPMLGQLDLALLPAVFIDRASLHYGGAGAMWGSGAVGGTLELDGEIIDDGPVLVDLRTAMGSFDRKDLSLRLDLKGQKLAGSTRFFYSEADNDFIYRIRPDLPERTISNAGTTQSGLLQKLDWQSGEQHAFSFDLWMQQADRQIPPLTTQTRSVANQDDGLVRGILGWKHVGKNSVFEAKAGYFYEMIDYADSLAYSFSHSTQHTGIAQFKYSRSMDPNIKLSFGIDNTRYLAVIESYAGREKLNRSAAFFLGSANLNNLDLLLGLRYELDEHSGDILLPSLTLKMKALKHFSLGLGIHRVFRRPTLNDLFWVPGGNPALQPESGWAEEVSFLYKKKWLSTMLEARLSAFYRNVDNWILWAPQDGQFYYSPQNIVQVRSRGLEQSIKFIFERGKFRTAAIAGYSLSISTNGISLYTPKIDKGEQIFYVPKHQAFFNLTIERWPFRIYYKHKYTDGVNTLSDPLPSFDVANLFIEMNFKLLDAGWCITGQVDNLWNENYRVIERRPMPGRNYKIGLQFRLNKQK